MCPKGLEKLADMGCNIALAADIIGIGLLAAGVYIDISDSWSALAIGLIASGGTIAFFGIVSGGVIFCRADYLKGMNKPPSITLPGQFE